MRKLYTTRSQNRLARRCRPSNVSSPVPYQDCCVSSHRKTIIDGDPTEPWIR
jgi:hypothetical protein